MQNFHSFGLQRVKGHFCFKMYCDSGSLWLTLGRILLLYLALSLAHSVTVILAHSDSLWLSLALSGLL